MTPEQEQAIRDLRAKQLAPKQIARQLGLRPAEVSAVLKAEAEQKTANRAATGELDPVYQCLINRGSLEYLQPGSGAAGSEQAPEPETATESENDPDAGLAVIVLARNAGFNRLDVCTYLVDFWCLGVKDTSGPRRMTPTDFKDFVEYAYQPFEQQIAEIPLELAQAIVLGSIEYAKGLGFEPHRDFAKTRSLLGSWNGQPVLPFGRNGKPFYINGPYDDPMKVLRTLRTHVGEGNFDFAIGEGH